MIKETQSVESLIHKPISGEWGNDVGEINVLRTTNFNNDGTLNLSEVVKRSIDSSKVDKKKLIYGDTIIEKSGGSPSQPVGRVVYFDIKDETFLCNNFTSVIRSKEELDSRYLFWYLYSNHLNQNTRKYQNKTTGIINLQLERYIKDLQIPLPPLPIQKRIAQILDAADALKRKDQQLLKKYDELAQAIFIDMFGDPVKNEKGWEVKTLGQFGKISTGNTPSRADLTNYNSNYVEWIKTDNIRENSFFVSNSSEYLSKIGVERGRVTPSGSLLVACIAGSIDSIGRAALTDRLVSFNQQINSIEPNEKVKSLFLYFLFKYSRKHIQNHASNGMKRMLSKGEFEKIKMISPDITIQSEFENKISQLVIQKEKMNKTFKNSDSLFNSLIQKAFNGELVA